MGQTFMKGNLYGPSACTYNCPMTDDIRPRVVIRDDNLDERVAEYAKDRGLRKPWAYAELLAEKLNEEGY